MREFSFDVLSFIDSKDIRDFNEHTVFYPIEQAVLIYKSQRRTMEEKMEAWKELLDVYSDEEFEYTQGGKRTFGELGNKALLSGMVCEYEKVLESLSDFKQVVFQTEFRECEYPERGNTFLFSMYEKAYEELVNEKQSYLEDDDLKDVVTKAKIYIRKLDVGHLGEDIELYYDNDLRLIDIFIHNLNDDYNLEKVFVYVPLPFKKGDLLRTIYDGEREYGVLGYEPTIESFQIPMKLGDMSDMMLTLETFGSYEGRFVFGYDHYDFMRLEKIEEEEVPDEEKNLILLSQVYKEEFQAGQLLQLYSYYREKAWEMTYGKHRK